MKRMKRVLAAVLATLVLTASAPVSAAPASETNGDYKLLALTFDDGPCKNTPRLLDGLAKLGAKATFFMVGKYIELYPDIPARMVAEGHQIANHSYSHLTLTYGNVAYQLGKTRQLLAQYGGDQTYYVRAPYGNDGARSAYNAPCIWVNLNVNDYLRTDSYGMARDVMRVVKDGDIFLFHDTHSTSVDAALIVVEELQKQGYEFVTVSELFRRRGVVPQNGVRYSRVPNKGINLGPLEEKVDPEYFDESKLHEHWAYEAIEYVLGHGLFNGTGEGFLPNKKMTRAMFLTVLGRLAGVSTDPPVPIPIPFTDVPATHWAAPYIAWAAVNGIIDTNSAAFDPDGYITREDMADMVYRYLKYAGLAGETEDTALSYADAGEISGSALEGVKYCTAVSLLVGDGVNFHPHDDTTRAQAATLFMRLDQFILALEQSAPDEDPSEETDDDGPVKDTTDDPEEDAAADPEEGTVPDPGEDTAAEGGTPEPPADEPEAEEAAVLYSY